MARASLYVPDANTFRSHLHKATRAKEAGTIERKRQEEPESSTKIVQTGTNYFAFLTRSLEFLILTVYTGERTGRRRGRGTGTKMEQRSGAMRWQGRGRVISPQIDRFLAANQKLLGEPADFFFAGNSLEPVQHFAGLLIFRNR